jgi:hypothetical protein
MQIRWASCGRTFAENPPMAFAPGEPNAHRRAPQGREPFALPLGREGGDVNVMGKR